MAGAVARPLETDVEASDGRNPAAMEALRKREGVLLRLSGLSRDCGTPGAAAQESHAEAWLALDGFVHRRARHVGGLPKPLGAGDPVPPAA